MNLDEGGMPWTCLPGEPSNVNWCNSAGGADLYKNPPAAWRGAKQHGVPPLLCAAVHALRHVQDVHMRWHHA